MTTATITVSLVGSPDETHEAEYFQVEDGFVTLKTSAGKLVAAYPRERVARVVTTMSPLPADRQQEILDGESPEAAYQVQIKVDMAHAKDYGEAKARAIAAEHAKWVNK